MASNSVFVEIESSKDYDIFEAKNCNCLIVVHFTAKWAAHCQQVQEVLKEIKRKLSASDIQFVEVEAEKIPALCQRYGIEAVPTCVMIKNKKELARVNGVNTLDLCEKIQQHAKVTIANTTKDLNSYLKSLINRSPVMVFMKGTPDQPRCGFSKTMMNLLREQSLEFGSFDILSNEEVRQGLKEYSNWPTYPQLYINGELVGGLDILKEMIGTGELASLIPKHKSLAERLRNLVNQEKIMLFMKGSPDDVKCGFSKSIVEIFNSKNAKYGHFDILSDEEVRQGLKTYSNWPTYPQLYIKGNLIGGLDIVKEMNQSGELDNILKDFI